jgi:hypothetical protein
MDDFTETGRSGLPEVHPREHNHKESLKVN